MENSKLLYFKNFLENFFTKELSLKRKLKNSLKTNEDLIYNNIRRLEGE